MYEDRIDDCISVTGSVFGQKLIRNVVSFSTSWDRSK